MRIIHNILTQTRPLIRRRVVVFVTTSIGKVLPMFKKFIFFFFEISPVHFEMKYDYSVLCLKN